MAADELFFHLYRRGPGPGDDGTVELSTALEPIREELEEIARAVSPADPERPDRSHRRLYDASYHALTRFVFAEESDETGVEARTFVVPDRWLAAGGHDLDAAFDALPWELLAPPHLEALDPDDRHALPGLAGVGATAPSADDRETDEPLGAAVEDLARTQASLTEQLGKLQATVAELVTKVGRLERSSRPDTAARPGAWWRDGRVLVLVGALLALLVASLAWGALRGIDNSSGIDLPLDRQTVGRLLETGASHEDPNVRDRTSALYLDLLLDEARTLGSRERDALVQQLVGDTPDGAFGNSSRQLLESYLDRQARCCSDLLGISRRTCVLDEALGLPEDVACAGRFPFDGDLRWSAESATALLELSRQARSRASGSMRRQLEVLDLTIDPDRARRLPTLVVDPDEAVHLADLATTLGWRETDPTGRVE